MSLSAPDALRQLRTNDELLYRAAVPNYPSNFSRDSLTYGLLAEDMPAIEAQVKFSAKHQGKKQDPLTGEEPGKVHHELNPDTGRGVMIDGLETTYNGCDTTASFLESIAWMVEHGKPEVLRVYAPNIEAGVGYIFSHVGEDNLFREDPRFCGALEDIRFALRVTTWKDSVVNGPDEDPPYPRIYTLAQFQNAHALGAIGRATNQPELAQKASEMEEAGIRRLWRLGHFVTAIDGQDEMIDPPSSDSLYSLNYIDPRSDSLPSQAAQSIEDYMGVLETKAGYRSGLAANGVSDNYHTGYVWTHEQAILHSAAQKHKLQRTAAVARRILPYFNGNYPELIDAETFLQAGNPVQLWAIGAHSYFTRTQQQVETKAA